MSSDPAFPVSTSDGTQGHQDGAGTWQFPGMSLRDYFSAKALPIAFDYVRRIDSGDRRDGKADSGECRYEIEFTADDGGDVDRPGGDLHTVAEYSYLLADAMLKAREE